MLKRRASRFRIPASVFDLDSRTGETIEINGIGKEPLYLVSKADYQILQELTSLEDEMLCRLGEERLRHFRERGEKAIPLDEVIRRTSFIGAFPGVAKRYDGPTESVWPIDDHDETGESRKTERQMITEHVAAPEGLSSLASSGACLWRIRINCDSPDYQSARLAGFPIMSKERASGEFGPVQFTVGRSSQSLR